ncbi:MAG: TylF/MycF/NovP-related O-methyltransferase [Solirubrobacteraceae bacterium]
MQPDEAHTSPDEAHTSRRSTGATARRGATTATGGLTAVYLELLKGTLTATVHQDAYVGRVAAGPIRRRHSWHPRHWAAGFIVRELRRRGWVLARRCPREALELGRVWPLIGETMIGIARLDNLQHCIERVVQERVPGHLIETGVWRGGASIFMRGVLRALDVTDRRVWVADSFQGLPRPDGRFPADVGDAHHLFSDLAVPLEAVKENFRRYGLLDAQVRFVPGWFRDTLPGLHGERWAIIRLDGDMYESTMEALEALYPQLSVGGYVIVDDGSLSPCRSAVEDFRRRNGIEDPIEWIDWTGFFWKRKSPVA